MIKGKEKKKWVTADDILSNTSGGYDIYMHYLGKVQRQMDRPWGHKEKKSSWGVYPFSGTWFWKDQATEEVGNAIQFVQKYFGLSYLEAHDKLLYDFGMGGKKNTNPVIITWDKPYMDDKEYVRINFTKQPFNEKHHRFWNIAQVSEEDCAKKECWAVKDLAIKGKRTFIGKEEVVFAFYCPSEDAVKLYFPERDKGERFRNNVSYHHLWNYEMVDRCDNLIVQKSPKDMVVTSMITPCVIATQAEAVKIFDEETVGRINTISKSPWIWYGSDWDGVTKCKKITDTNKWKYINTEKKYLPDVNDVYGLVKMFNEKNPGSGLRELEDFMKKKKVI